MHASTRLFAIVGSWAGLIVVLVGTARAALTEDQVAYLKELDPQAVALCLELSDGIGEIREVITEVTRLRDQRRAAGDGEDLLETVDSENDEIARLFDIASKMADQVDSLSNLGDEFANVARIVEEVEQRIDRAKNNYRENEDVSRDDFALLIEGLEQEQHADELLKELTATIEHVERLREPAQYVRDFAKGKLKQWLNEALAGDESDTVKFRIINVPDNVSLFSEDANLGIEIVYLPGQLSLKATGIYFKYREGQPAPLPAFDRIKIDPDEQARIQAGNLVLEEIKDIGNEALAELGWPVTIKITGIPDFATSDPQRRGALPFDIKVGLDEVGTHELFVAEAKGLLLQPGPKIEWKDTTLLIEVPLRPPIPIAAAPAFAFWAVDGELKLNGREFAIGTTISSTTTPPRETFGVKGKLRSSIPVKKLTLVGEVTVADQPGLCKVEGSIDFATGTIAGEITEGVPIDGLDGLTMRKGTFELKSEYLILEGSMTVLNANIASVKTTASFENKNMVFSGRAGLELFGTSFGETLEGEIYEGFAGYRLSAVRTFGVDVKPWRSVSATVEIGVDTRKGPGVDVHVKAFTADLDFTVHVDSFTDCTMDNLRKWIEERAVDGYHRFLQDLANLDEGTRDLAAQFDKKVRDALNDQFGGPWSSGNDKLDAFGAELSKDWKSAGGALAQFNQDLGQAATNGREGVQDLVKEGGNSIVGGGKQVIETVTNPLGL